MIITDDMLLKANIDKMWKDELNSCLNEYDITEPIETSMFIAQCSYESRHFTMLEENLNYSAERLLEVFPKRFSSLEEAKILCGDGVKAIGNYLYNGRLGNRLGSNDGYIYRGRGIIQITGRANYAEFAKKINVDILSYPILAKEKYNAIKIACEFWVSRKCKEAAKKGDVLTVTKIINGGYNGIAGRERIFFEYERIFI